MSAAPLDLEYTWPQEDPRGRAGLLTTYDTRPSWRRREDEIAALAATMLDLARQIEEHGARLTQFEQDQQRHAAAVRALADGERSPIDPGKSASL